MCHEESRNVSAGFTTKTKNVTARTTGRSVWSKNQREKHQLEATSAAPSSRNTALMFRAERLVAVPYTEGF